MLPPIQRIFGIGLNYRDHATEMNKPIPAHPELFMRPLSCLLPAGQALTLPSNSSKVDYEAELGVLVGTAGKFISPDKALSHVAAYCIACDVSVRDFQGHGSQWTAGKIFDGTLPIGPFTPANPLHDPQNLDIALSINDRTLQQSHTSQMIFSVAQILAYISNCLALQPGDLIITGTPAGVGIGQNPKRYLEAGDHVLVNISQLATLDFAVTTAI